ncbi:MAG: hypothetical protein IBX71_11565 [Candidatus Desulforudis sp.]|nr:hypothetical protein [Desulforudis sp.]
MLEDFIVIGVVMAIVEALKKRNMLAKEALFVPVLGLAALLNGTNAYFFNGITVTEAVADGIRLGAIAAGIYGLGKAALGKS